MDSQPILICPQWLVPVIPREKVLVDHALLINQGKIVALDKRAQLLDAYPQAQVIELKSHALLPGFINTHCHAAMSLFRGMADDLPLSTWLNDHIWPAEHQWVSEQFVADGTRLAIAEMLCSGTTCFADMYFHPNISAAVAQDAGIRAVIGLMMIDFPTPWGEGPDDYITKGIAVYDEIKSLSLVNASWTPHAPYSVSDEALQRVQVIADELNLNLQMHIHETVTEVDEATRDSGIRPLQRLYDLGILSPKMLAVHMTELSDEDIDLSARCGLSVGHCPESNMKLGNSICRVADLLDAGVNVALGTDGAASNNDLDMLGEMRSASLAAKSRGKSAASISAWQALEMATINGAKALNLAESIGSLEIGKCADIVAIDLNQLNTQPVYEPVSQIVYAAKSSQISHVWVDGKLRVQNHQLVDLDTSILIQNAQQWAARIRA